MNSTRYDSEAPQQADDDEHKSESDGETWKPNEKVKDDSPLLKHSQRKRKHGGFDIPESKKRKVHEASYKVRSTKKGLEERPPRPEQPNPPTCYPGPASIHFTIPKIPHNTTFVTIRFAKEGEKYQVYDWRSKTLMKKGGNAIPIEEFHKDMIIKVEPECTYQVKYCVRVGENWSKSSPYIRCTSLIAFRIKPTRNPATPALGIAEIPIFPFHLDYFQATVFHMALEYFGDANIASDLATFISLADERSLRLAKKYRAHARAQRSRRKRKRETIDEVFVLIYTTASKDGAHTQTKLCATFSIAVNAMYDSLLSDKSDALYGDYILGKAGQKVGWGYVPDWVEYHANPESVFLAEHGDDGEENIWEVKRGVVHFE